MKKIFKNKPKSGAKGGVFKHNWFVLLVSLGFAIFYWVGLNASNTEERPRTLYDVPIEIELSESAQADGIKIFSQSYKTADISLTGSSVVVNKVTADDINVIATLSPNSTKLTGNTMATDTIQLSVVKNDGGLTDYEVSSINPETITVSYDKYKEVTFKVENNISVTTNQNYYSTTPEISVENVTVSGPESAVNRVAKITASRTFAEPLTSSQSFTCNLTALDEDGKEINLESNYLTLSTTQCDVNVTVLSKKTVNLKVNTVNMPSGFSDTRITLDPETIDIAGEESVVSQYKEIALPDTLDFSTIDTSTSSFTMEIPIPSSCRNVSKVDQVTVTVNLNGFKEKTIDVPASRISFSNVPKDKTAELVNKTIKITVVGSSAQVNELDANSISGTIDMANLTDVNGNTDATVSFSISDSSSTSCWVYGKYTATVTVADASETRENSSSQS